MSTRPRAAGRSSSASNQQKSEERKKKNPSGRKGCRKAASTIWHRPGRCGGCGSPNLEAVRTDNKIVMDIPDIPKVEVVNHRTDTCRCLNCGGITIPEMGLVRGTSLRPNLLKMVVGLWKMNGRYQGIADLFSGLFGIRGCAKYTIQHSRDGVADLMESEVDAIAEEMISGDGPVGIDETDCRDVEARHARLQLVYHQAKETASAAPAQCETFVQRTVQIALTYPEKMSNKIISAAPFLFTFLLHPGM